ncbi:hypothetical protein CEXT_412331 [Caerostris extrusa]|uniref:Uncharacterized protein n=1 Tax=Caerostris extrusa TaxID=172846 RepID=A0AAV4R8Z2_CAEEX|nr:hypothetical protein CEXT_412331 [Caerostris extrusa]
MADDASASNIVSGTRELEDSSSGAMVTICSRQKVPVWAQPGRQCYRSSRLASQTLPAGSSQQQGPFLQWATWVHGPQRCRCCIWLGWLKNGNRVNCFTKEFLRNLKLIIQSS